MDWHISRIRLQIMVDGEATTGCRALNPSSASASPFPESAFRGRPIGKNALTRSDTVDATEHRSGQDGSGLVMLGRVGG
jgi:hypothetical protein